MRDFLQCSGGGGGQAGGLSRQANLKELFISHKSCLLAVPGAGGLRHSELCAAANGKWASQSWPETSDQTSGDSLEFASRRRGHRPEWEGQQEIEALGECGQVGWGWGAGARDPAGVVDSTRFGGPWEWG